jgi:hypothetical protein
MRRKRIAALDTCARLVRAARRSRAEFASDVKAVAKPVIDRRAREHHSIQPGSHIEIKDAAALNQAACECYSAVKSQYRRLRFP